MIGVRWIYVRWWVRWLPLLLLLAAAYWRWHELADQSFWHDEGNTLRLVQRNLTDLINAVKPDIHPPGYYLLLKGWTTFTGEHEIGLRSYSVFWGLITVALTYALGARLYTKAAGILAAVLVAVNPFAVYYSQEARMYAQLAGVAVASLYVMVRLVQAAPGHFVRWAVALSLINTLGLYTQYTYPFTMLVQGFFFLWWWLARRQPRPLLIYIAANLFTLCLYAPWLPIAYDQITGWVTFSSELSFLEKLEIVLTYITYGNSAWGLTWVNVLPPLVLGLTILLPDWYPQPPAKNWRVLLPLAWVLIIVGALLGSGAYREANLKFLLPAQVGLALILGRGAYLLWDMGSNSPAVRIEMLPRYVALIAYLLTINTSYSYLGELYTHPDYQRDDYRGMAAYIRANERPGDAIILNAPNQAEVFSFYYQGKAVVYPLPRGLGGDDAATQRDMEQVIQQHLRIFVLFWGEQERDPNGIVKNTLDTQAYEVGSRWYGRVRLAQYAVLAPPPAAPDQVINTRFGDHILLQGYAINGQAVAGGVLGVTLFWQTEQPLSERYKISVQLLDAAGQLVSQHDSEPANNRALTPDWTMNTTIIDNHGLPIPTRSSPGEHTIMVSVYAYDPPYARLPVGNSDFIVLEKVIIQ